VIRTAQDGRELTSERYEYLQGEQARFAVPVVPYWTDPSQPQLPPAGMMPGDAGAPASGPAAPAPHPLEPFMPKPKPKP